MTSWCGICTAWSRDGSEIGIEIEIEIELNVAHSVPEWMDSERASERERDTTRRTDGNGVGFGGPLSFYAVLEFVKGTGLRPRFAPLTNSARGVWGGCARLSAPVAPRKMASALHSSFGASTMSFDTLELSLVVVRKLRRLHERLRKSDPQLATQIRRAASSVALKLSEGNKRRGRDRQHLFRVAHGSAAEVHTALRVACA